MLRIELMRVDGIEPAPGGGERDPFVYFKVGDGDEEATSSKVLGTSEPTWDPPEVRRFCSFLFASLFFCFSYATRGSSVLFFSVRFASLRFSSVFLTPHEVRRFCSFLFASLFFSFAYATPCLGRPHDRSARGAEGWSARVSGCGVARLPSSPQKHTHTRRGVVTPVVA